MLRCLLAGAGLMALLDAWLGLPMPGEARLAREYTILTVGVGWALALAVGLVAKVLLRTPLFAWARDRAEGGSAFFAGMALTGMPMLSMVAPIVHLPFLPHALGLVAWCIPCGLLLLFGPRLPKSVAQSAGMGVVATLPLLALAVCWIALPSAVPDGYPTAGSYTASEDGASTDFNGEPDIVVVSIDTLRVDLTRDGQALLPVLEDLRAEALWHAAAYTPANQTVPGHLAMLAGLEPDQHLVGQNVDMGLVPTSEEERPLLAQQLHHSGYRTAGIISNAMVEKFEPGYEVWDDTRALYGPRFFFTRTAGKLGWLGRIGTARRAQNWVSAWLEVEDLDLLPPGMSTHATDQGLAYHSQMIEAGGRPLHLFVHYMDPHSPYWAPGTWRGMFSEGQALPKRFAPWTEDHRILINRVRTALSEGEEPERADAEAAAQLMHRWYDEELAAMNADIARLVEGIRAAGRPTLLIITSDHGEHFGEHGLMEHSNSLFEELVRVPFLMLGMNGFDAPTGELPGAPSTIDVVPTALNAAKISFRSGGSLGLRGANLLDESSHTSLVDRQLLLGWSSGKKGTLLAAVARGRKVFAEIDAPASEDEPAQVRFISAFETSTDPQEAQDLLPSGANWIQPLQNRIELARDSWMSLGFWNEDMRGAASKEQQAVLEAMGYLGAPK